MIFIQRAKVILSNSDEIIIDENSFISGITTNENPTDDSIDKVKVPLTTSIVEGLDIYSHHHAGLIPCLTEILINYEFFTLEDPNKETYASASVVKIINL